MPPSLLRMHRSNGGRSPFLCFERSFIFSTSSYQKKFLPKGETKTQAVVKHVFLSITREICSRTLGNNILKNVHARLILNKMFKYEHLFQRTHLPITQDHLLAIHSSFSSREILTAQKISAQRNYLPTCFFRKPADRTPSKLFHLKFFFPSI
jgi:hypothetical protein